MSRRPAPLPASLPWRVFTRAEALRAGVPPGRLRREDLKRLRPGLLRRADLPLNEADIASALCRDEPQAVVVGPSAARLLGIPLPSALEAWRWRMPVQISVPGGRKGSDHVVRWRGLIFSRGDVWNAELGFDPVPDQAPRDPLPDRLTSRARTWRDLAGLVMPSALVEIGDHLVRTPRPGLESRSTPWCTIDDLRAASTGRHAPALREALAQVRVGSDSPRETRLRLAFARAGLPEPLLNVPLVGDDGVARHEPDFLWPEQRVCAEYEGRHHSDPCR